MSCTYMYVANVGRGLLSCFGMYYNLHTLINNNVLSCEV